MSDYIKREAALSDLNYILNDPACPIFIAATVDQILSQLPAAPVREIVRGKWIETEERFEDDWGFTIVQHCVCSVCGFTQSRSNTYTPGGEIRKSNFCPNCGADMRAEEGDAT